MTLPASWVEANVGDLATLADGPFGSNLKTSHYTATGPRVIRLQNIGDGAFRDERAHITDAHFAKLSKHAVVAGDVVAASLGENAPRAALVPPWLGPAVVKADCIRIRPAADVIPAYLMWALNSPAVRGAAATSIKGVGRPRLGLKGIKTLMIPLPPLAEQRRIVAAIEEQFSRLDAVDQAFTAATRRAEILRRACLAAACGGDTPFRLLGDVAETQLGKMLSTKSKVGDRPQPYLRNKSVQWYRVQVHDLPTMDFSETERAKFKLRPGDVLVCEGGEVGRAAIWRGELSDCYFQKALHRVRPGPELDGDFLVHVLKWFSDREAFDSYVTGSTIKHLPQEDFRRLPIPLPPLDEQRSIVAAVEQQLSLIDSLRAAVASAQKRSAALRRAILERAFRGELVPQDPADEPASVLLERIRAERAATPPTKRRARR